MLLSTGKPKGMTRWMCEQGIVGVVRIRPGMHAFRVDAFMSQLSNDFKRGVHGVSAMRCGALIDVLRAVGWLVLTGRAVDLKTDSAGFP